MGPSSRAKDPQVHLALFFVLAFAGAWAAWAAAMAIPETWPAARGLVVLLGVFAPALTAVALTAGAEGRAGVWALLRRIGKVRVGVRWYLFAVLYMAGVKLLAALLHRLLLGAWPRFGHEPLWLMAAALVISTLGQAGEEVGWRGYALPRLAARMGLGAGSVVLGALWAAWHLPLFFAGGGDTQGQSFPLYLLQVTALSVALAWLYLRTGGSLLLVMLMHSAVNNTKDIVPSAVPGASNALSLHGSAIGWLTVALLWAAAAVFLVWMRRADLGRTLSSR